MTAQETFNKLTAISFNRFGSSQAPSHEYWNFQCSCGTVKAIQVHNVETGRTKSCGCEKEKSHMKELNSPEAWSLYLTWKSMNSRCNNPRATSYQHYGGRGIKVCLAWKDFQVFRDYIGLKPTPQHSLDRINVNGNYEPGNVRWATPQEQRHNKRK